MFFGSLPHPIGNYFFREINRIKPKRVFVPFSGSFSLEQIIASASRDIQILASDVNIYSAAIGLYLSNKPLNFSLAPLAFELAPSLRNISSDEDIVSAVLLLSDLSRIVSGAEKHMYYVKLLKHVLKHFDEKFLIAKQKLQVLKNNVQNIDFYPMDATLLLEKLEPHDCVFFDPPYFKGDYEKMYKNLMKYFTYTLPTYTEFTPELMMQKLKEYSSNNINVFYRCQNIHNNIPDNFNLLMIYQQKYHDFHYLYSNVQSDSAVKRYKVLNERIPKFKVADADFEFTENTQIHIVRIDGAEANHYRMMWIKKAEVKPSEYSFAVIANNQIIGIICVNSSIKFGSELLQLISDPPSPYTKYKRLSKLILHVALTEQFIKMVNEMCLWKHSGLVTIAFTNNAVSMKYRGLFELADRVEFTEGNYKYKLVYHSKKLFKDYSTAYKTWFKKYGNQKSA